MPNGFLNISHNFAGELNYIIVEWVKSTAQGTPVIGHVTGGGLGAQNDTDQTEVFYPAPHVNKQLQVINLPEVWMLVRFWRSSDGSAKEFLLLELAGNARTGAVYPISRYEYVVGRGEPNDPEPNDTGLRDERLEGKTFWIEERGTGTLIASEWTDRSDDGGGFDFTQFGKVMNNEAVYVVYVIERIEITGDDSGITVDGDDDIYILDSNQDYNPLLMGNKTLIADFSTTVGTLTIPNLLLVADSKFKLQTQGGMQRNVVIQFDVGDTVKFRKQNVNKIILGEAEEIEIFIKNNIAYVRDPNTGHDKLGMLDFGYLETLNRIPGDGVSRVLAEWPRIEELLNALPASSIVNEVTWNTSSTAADGQTVYLNRGKWMRDGLNFRPPLLTDKVIKGISIASISGRYEHQEIMAHDHDLRGSFSYGGYDGGSNAFFRIRNLTDGFDSASKVMSDAGGSNNIVNNIGLYPLLCI